MQSIKRVAVTGAGGQIAYSLLFRIASGELLGKDQPVALHLLEVPAAVESLKGVAMELEDCAFPLLKEIRIGSDSQELFKDVDYAFLVGAKPRGPGMERKDLLADNGKIFIGQGQALDAVASKEVIVLVVGNPCNTNCLIALKQTKRLKSSQFFAMTRLDQNRAVSLLARQSGMQVTDVSHMTIWGNHSSTQVPDFVNARIGGRPVTEVIRDQKWLEGSFISEVQKRGATVIAARGKSSAASAAHAALQAMQSLIVPTAKNEWFSMSLFAQGNPYGIEQDLVFSFPCRSKGQGKIEIVKDVPWNDFLKNKIALSEKELIEERELIKGMWA